MATKHKKIKLFRDLLFLMSDLKTESRLVAKLILIKIFYLIFGFENKVIDNDGFIYNVSDREELISIFTIAANSTIEDKNAIGRYHSPYYLTYTSTDDLEIYVKVFEKLKQMGFDFEYVTTQSQPQEGFDLERADRLIDTLKQFLAEDKPNDNFIEAQALLSNIDLHKIQEQLKEQILYKKIGELEPDKILVAYYKVYQKLPGG